MSVVVISYQQHPDDIYPIIMIKIQVFLNLILIDSEEDLPKVLDAGEILIKSRQQNQGYLRKFPPFWRNCRYSRTEVMHVMPGISCSLFVQHSWWQIAFSPITFALVWKQSSSLQPGHCYIRWQHCWSIRSYQGKLLGKQSRMLRRLRMNSRNTTEGLWEYSGNTKI